MYMWNVFIRIHTVCAGYFYPTSDEPKVARDVGRLPNITGYFNPGGNGIEAYGAFQTQSDAKRSNEGGMWDSRFIDFDSSRSSTLYGAATTVQPSSMRAQAFIKF